MTDQVIANNQALLLQYINAIKLSNLPINIKKTLIKQKIDIFLRIKNYIIAQKNKELIFELEPTKTALLIGINYRGTIRQLDGCINDVHNTKNALIKYFGFKEQNITIITDDTIIKPTKDNIITYVTNLLQNSKSGDCLFLGYSGHGTRIPSLNNDEYTFQDQLIVPIDATSIQQCIKDDELNNILRNNLKENVKLFGLMDACYSGTIFDLKYNYMTDLQFDTTNYNNKFTITNNPNINSIGKGQVFILSGSKDEQKSADASVTDSNGKNLTYAGAMTYCFLKAIEELNNDTSLQNILQNIRDTLKKNRFTQIPQISSDTFVDISAVSLNQYLSN